MLFGQINLPFLDLNFFSYLGVAVAENKKASICFTVEVFTGS